ncbi:MAG: hypothetical protein ACR2QK_06745 [Acidimicrobiales bacterium]
MTPIPYGDNDYEGDEYPGDKIFLTTFENAEWTGVFEGTSRDYGLIIADPPLQPSAFAATVLFDSVEVKGVEGGMVLDVWGGTGVGDQWDGRFTISSGTGDLSRIEGYGSWWGPGFDPDNADDCGVIYYDVERLRGVDPPKRRPLRASLEISATEADFKCQAGEPTGQVGSGRLSYLGRVEISGGHCTDFAGFPLVELTDGFGTYVARNGDAIEVAYSGEATPSDDGSAFNGEGSAEIVGGTGRFQKASGEFDFTVTTPVNSDGSFGVAQLKGRGWIAYDRSRRGDD